MHEVRVNTNPIELQVRHDAGTGQALLFLHFSGANLMMWARAVPYFQDQYRLVLVDLRGHGKSDRPETGYHVDDMASDIVGVLQQLGLERAHILGSSLGAEVGLSLAANDPEKVISLVCDGALSSEFGPYGTWEGSEAEFEAHVAQQLAKLHAAPETFYPSVEALVAKSRAGLEEIGWWNADVEAMERYGACQVGEGAYTTAFSRKALADYLQGYFKTRFEDYYRKVQCPVLMLPGADVFENAREKAAMEGLCALAAQAQIVKVSGWEHPYGWLIHPEAACQAILEFLGRVPH